MCVCGCGQHQTHGADFMPAFGVGSSVKKACIEQTCGRQHDKWQDVQYHHHPLGCRCSDKGSMSYLPPCVDPRRSQSVQRHVYFSQLSWSIPWTTGACKLEDRHCPIAHIVVELFMWVFVTRLFELHTGGLLRAHMMCGTSCC